jgi:hypothetical protein
VSTDFRNFPSNIDPPDPLDGVYRHSAVTLGLEVAPHLLPRGLE